MTMHDLVLTVVPLLRSLRRSSVFAVSPPSCRRWLCSKTQCDSGSWLLCHWFEVLGEPVSLRVELSLSIAVACDNRTKSPRPCSFPCQHRTLRPACPCFDSPLESRMHGQDDGHSA